MNTDTTWSASTLLALSESEATRLFKGPPSRCRTLYRRLLREWHPDRNPSTEAAEVFIHIRRLYAVLMGRPSPSTPPEQRFTTTQGRTFAMKARRWEPFELGQVGFADHHIFLRTTPEMASLFQAAQKATTFRFADSAMKEQFHSLLPKPVFHEGPEGGLMVVSRPKGLVRLRTLLNDKPVLPGRHVAWIVSALLNILCYLDYAHLTHHALTAENIWVDLANHRVALLGGWFYALPVGQTLTALPAGVMDALPSDYVSSKTAEPRADLYLVQALARELLGSRDGMGLSVNADVPEALVRALRLPPALDALTQYRAWKDTLVKAFGPPRFEPFLPPYPTHD